MIANYHTHTARCLHAAGTEIQYIEAAIERGFKIFGFSDHTPQWYPEGYYSGIRMEPEQLQEYCDTVRRLQQQYKDQLEIPLGLEVEYYPALFGELMSRLRDQGVEYILLAQHWVGNEINEPYCGRATEDASLLQRYCDQVIAAMETGLFTYVAHPDLIYFTGDRKIYAQHMRRLCRAAVQTDTPLEINLLGQLRKRHYPREYFWEIAAQEGCKTVLGLDSHDPESILECVSEDKALQMVDRLGLQLVDTVPLKRI